MSCCHSGGKSMQNAVKARDHKLVLKRNRLSSQLKLLPKLLCPLVYMKLKRRELVYLLRVGYMRYHRAEIQRVFLNFLVFLHAEPSESLCF